MPYSDFLAAGGSPAQARILAAIEMAESGGNPNAHNYRAPGTWGPQDPGENSYGPMQINLFSHPDVTPQQAMNPAFAARWALAQGSYTPWSTYNNGAYRQYLVGDAAMPTPDATLASRELANSRSYVSPVGSRGSGVVPIEDAEIGDVIRILSDGSQVVVTGFDPDTEEPRVQIVRPGSRAGGSRAARPLSPVSTGIEGLLYDPNTGQPVDLRPQPRYVTSTRDLGNGILGIVDDRGHVVSTTVAPVNDFERAKLSEDIRQFNDSSARGWQGLDWANRHYDQDFGLRKGDVTGYFQDKPTFAREQWNFNRGLREGELTGQYGDQPTERRYEFDATEQRMLAQFEGDLQEKIAARQQRLQEIAIQEQGATGRQAAALAAESANLQAKLSNDLAIAGMDNSTKLDIAKMQARLEGRGQDIQQRGQDIQAGVAYRGQDVDLQGQALQAQQRRAEYGIEALRNDPFAQATFLLGGDPTASMTPAQYAIKSMEVPHLRPVGAAPNLPGQVKPAEFRHGGSVVESDEPVLTIVGEEDPSSAEAALLAPGSAVEPLRLSRHASSAQMERAAVNALPRLRKRLTRMVEGGAVQPWSAVASSFKPGGYSVNSWGWNGPSGKKKQNVVEPTLSIQPVGQPQPVPTPLPQFVPEDALLGTFSPSDLLASRKTVADALIKSMYGGGMPEFGALPKVNPVFGVDMTQPEQLAGSFWRNPAAARKLITSAWGMRNMPEDEFYRRLQAATPEGVRPFVPQYGRRGIAIVPVRRAA